MALILLIVANSRCSLVDVSDVNTTMLGVDETPTSVGVWCYEGVNGDNYDTRDLEVDRKYDTARAMGVTTLCVGVLVFTLHFLAERFPMPRSVFAMLGWLGILNAMFQGLVFLIFKSDLCHEYATCELGRGGKCGIAACVFWFLTSFASEAEPEPATTTAAEDEEPKDDNPVNPNDDVKQVKDTTTLEPTEDKATAFEHDEVHDEVHDETF